MNYYQVKNLQNGDRTTFSAIYAKYYQNIFRFANSYVHDSFVAGNIVQDAFLALWDNRTRLKDDTNIPSYLLTIVKNGSLNHLNRLKTKIKAEENVQNHYLKELELRCSTLNACNPEQLFGTDIEEIVQTTLNYLPDKCRRAFWLSRFGGLTNEEIARNMSISIKGVEFHITKALKLLRENLKDYLTTLIIIALNYF